MNLNRDRIRSLPVLFAIIFILLTTSGLAQEAVLELDPSQTQIDFTLGDILHTVHGTFQLKRGTIQFDSDTGQASGSVVVDATSGQSGSRGRDNKMHKDILESRQYPEIVLSVLQVQGHIASEGDSEVQVQGIFRIHGADHNISFKAHIHLAGEKLTGYARLPIPYVQWGLRNPSTFILRVKDTVDIDLHVAGKLSTQQVR
jgi:polyisoprenoid-binding protein YceI